jgi:CheY-like chemotaxis protein
MTTYRILIIDDQHEVRHMLASALRLLGPNFDVLEVPSAEEGFLLALRGGVDLLVADVRLPGISGLELVEKIHVRNPELKIILITGVEEHEVRQQVAGAQVDAYFFKPIVIDEFIRTVLDCLGVKQEDQVRSLEAEGEVQSSGEVAADSPESLTERLYTLRIELKAYAALILDREGRVLAQSGMYPPLFSEPAALPSLIDAWNAGERFSAALGMDLSSSLLSFGGQDYHLILTHVGKLCMLVVVVPGARFQEGRARALRKAQGDLGRILRAIGMPLAEEAVTGAGVLVDLRQHPVDSDLADIDVLLQQLGQAEVGEDVDAFWEQALERDEFTGMESGGALSYDQARRLGLAPEGEEQSQSEEEPPPDVSEA